MNLFISKDNKISLLQQVFNRILLTLILVVLFWLMLSKVGISFDFSFIGEFNQRIMSGFMMTIYLSLVSFVVSLVLGILSALGQSSKVILVKYLSQGYVTIIRGTPLITQIYLFFYIVGSALAISDRFIAGVIILSIFEGAYISEIIRGSYLSLSKGQLEVAKSVGFSKRQTFKFVIFPQLFVRTLPALTGQFASIIKDSSLLSMIAVVELAQTIREISAYNFRFFETYFFLGVLYLVLTLPISYFSKKLEKRYQYEH